MCAAVRTALWLGMLDVDGRVYEIYPGHELTPHGWSLCATFVLREDIRLLP